MTRSMIVILVGMVWAMTTLAQADDLTASPGSTSAKDLAYFESNVRPLLARRCYECHSQDQGKAKGNLTLDSRAGWQRGGDTGPAIVAGRPDESLLIRAVEHSEAGYEMPPSGKLPNREIHILREWIRRGAPDPRVTTAELERSQEIDIEAGRQFWSFRPVTAPPIPSVSESEWAVRDLDRFVLAKLELEELTPSRDNDAARFLRRLYYDLTGLPPASEEVRNFMGQWNGDAAGAVETPDSEVQVVSAESKEQSDRVRQTLIERTVDRLLSTRQFGEKWGRHWLDLARYADSNGSSFNPPYPNAWRYRNWVIEAHNRDLPFDQFVAKQIAGDLLPYDTQPERDENLIATGYLMFGSKVLGQFDKELLTMDVVDEQLDTISKSLLGLTLGCARCHDHKFDPVPQRDYYALAGIFTSTVTLQDRLGGPKEDESDWSRRGLGVGGDEQLQAFLSQYRYEWVKTGQKRYEAERKILTLERQEIRQANASEKLDSRRADNAEAIAKARDDYNRYAIRLGELQAMMPQYAEAVADSRQVADTQIRIRGIPSSKGATVPRGFLQVAAYDGQPVVPAEQSGRLQLAQWIASPHNPLTARVYVNRVWKHLFGQGIVRSVDNFGLRGDAPSHPELLDHLATRFIANGWRLKPLVREIVTSRAYRMSTSFNEHPSRQDPENHWFWRQNKRRLEPEEIRDTLLQLSGQLDRSPAESLIAHLPLKDINGGDAGAIDIHDNRRTVYQPIIRTMEVDVLQIFDFANTAMTTGQRPQTTIAPQALYFLNSPFVQASAQRFAQRTNEQWNDGQLDSFVRRAFLEAVCRNPTELEARLLADYLATQFEGPPGPTVHDLRKLCQAIVATTQFQFLD